MSGNKPPQNPAGGGERTVIVRPNPGGRGPAPPPQPMAPSPGADIWGAGDQGYPPRTGAVPPAYHPAPAYPQPPAYQPQAGYAPAYTGQISPQPMPQMPQMQRASSGQPLDLGLDRHPDVAGPNPILTAARPLLLLLASLRLTADHSRAAPMMDAIADSIAGVDRDLNQQGISPEHVRAAKYAMCATTDDIVQNLPGSDRLLWTQYSMLSRYFGVTTSGVGFFEELNRAKAQPTLNYDVLELMHACLSLGFQGQYRSGAGGEVALQQIRRDLYQTLRTFKPRAGEDISPHWRGQDLKPQHMQTRLPVWAVAAAAGVVLLAAFLGLRFLLGTASDALADRMAGLHPLTEVRLARNAPRPPQQPETAESQQLVRVRTGLLQEISAKKLVVYEAKGMVVVKLLSDALFEPGSADVHKDFVPILEKTAAILDKEPREIPVIGHTDNSKLKSRLRFKDNQDLSEQRAKAVAEIMAPKLRDPDRLRTSGRGPDQPLKDNKTRDGRAANRRVEIFLPRTGP